MWSWRRRWGEGRQNMASFDSPDWACGQGKLTFDLLLLETESAYTPSPSSAVRQVKVARLSRGPPLPARTPKVSSYISNGRDRENNDRDRS
jgi:hypothetical protein